MENWFFSVSKNQKKTKKAQLLVASVSRCCFCAFYWLHWSISIVVCDLCPGNSEQFEKYLFPDKIVNSFPNVAPFLGWGASGEWACSEINLSACL